MTPPRIAEADEQRDRGVHHALGLGDHAGAAAEPRQPVQRGLEVKEVGYFINSVPVRHVQGEVRHVHLRRVLAVDIRPLLSRSLQFRNLKTVFSDSLHQTFKAIAPNMELLGKFVRAQTKDASTDVALLLRLRHHQIAVLHRKSDMSLTAVVRRVLQLLGGLGGVTSIGIAALAFVAWLALQRKMHPAPVISSSGRFGLWAKPLPADTGAMPVFVAVTVTDPVAPMTISQVSAGLKNAFLDRGLAVTEAPYDSIGEATPHTRIVFDLEKTGSYIIQTYVHCPIQVITRTGGQRTDLPG